MSSVAFAFSTEVGKGLVECFEMKEWLSSTISFGSHGMSGKTFPFPFTEALVYAPEPAGKLTSKPSPLAFVKIDISNTRGLMPHFD